MSATDALQHKWIHIEEQHVSTKNLFGSFEKDAGGAAADDEEDGPTQMANMLADLHFERKADELIKKLNLPADEMKIKKFGCALVNNPGQMHVTTRHLCFLGSMGKKIAIPMADIKKIAKAKRFKISPGEGHSLHVTTADGAVHKFTGVTHREDCLAAICEQAKQIGAAITVE